MDNGTKFLDILSDLAQKKKFNQSVFKNNSLEPGTPHKSATSYSLKLVDKVKTQLQKVVLLGGDVAKIVILSNNIVKKMQMKCWKLNKIFD